MRLRSFEFALHAKRKCAFGERARLSEHFGIEKGEKIERSKDSGYAGFQVKKEIRAFLRQPELRGNGPSFIGEN